MQQPRPAEEKRAEQEAIIRCLVAFFESRGWPPILPLFAVRGSSAQLELFDDSIPVGDIVDVVCSAVNELRSTQSKISARYKLGSAATVMDALRGVAHGEEAYFNRHDAFVTLAASYSITVAKCKVLRRHGLSLTPAAEEHASSSEDTGGPGKADDLAGSQTRAAYGSACHAAALKAAALQLNGMAPEERLFIGRLLESKSAVDLVAGHTEAGGSLEPLVCVAPPEQLTALMEPVVRSCKARADEAASAAAELAAAEQAVAVEAAALKAARDERARFSVHTHMRAIREAREEAATELEEAVRAAGAEAEIALEAALKVAMADHESLAKHAVAQLDERALESLLDTIGARLLGSSADSRDAACLRRCIVVKRRIKAWADVDGEKQPDFLQSILEAYGADDGERLPLGSFLSVLMFAATRVADEANWGKSLSGLKFQKVHVLLLEPAPYQPLPRLLWELL